MRILVLSVFLIMSCFASSQVQTYYIKPVSTNANYASNEDSSAVSHNSSLQVNKLFLFLGGTNSSSSDAYNALRIQSTNLGFDFINLSYLNTVAAASLSNDPDSLVFDKYRQEICFGTSISPDVTVDSLNSISTRVLNLLNYLDATYPSDNWGQYLFNNTIDWPKIVIGGHSQGSGHAAYIGKQFPVDRVLMFSGPNDYSDYHSNPANWLSLFGATPIQHHFCYLSLNDEIVDFSKQFANMEALNMLDFDDSTYIDNMSPPYTGSRFLYTTQSPGIVLLNHNVPVKFGAINNNVWEYMLTTPIVMGFDEEERIELSLFPNPANSILHIKSAQSMEGKEYLIRNVSGQSVLTDLVRTGFDVSIDIASLKPGVYFLTIGKNTRKLIKQ